MGGPHLRLAQARNPKNEENFFCQLLTRDVHVKATPGKPSPLLLTSCHALPTETMDIGRHTDYFFSFFSFAFPLSPTLEARL